MLVSLFDGFVTNVPCPNEEIVSRVWASSVTWFLYFCLSGSLLLLELLRLSRNALHLIHPRIGSWGGDTSTGTDNDLTRWIRAGVEGRSELSELNSRAWSSKKRNYLVVLLPRVVIIVLHTCGNWFCQSLGCCVFLRHFIFREEIL